MVDVIKNMYEKQGLSQSEIARRLNRSRTTIRRYINGSASIYRRETDPSSPKKNAIRSIVETWLSEDKQAPRKQKRTRYKIFKDLVRLHDYDGSYSTVKEVVNDIKGLSNETFVPRHHQPGRHGEFDFGELYIDIGLERVRVYLHAYQLPFSNKRFGYISLRATQEEMFASHKKAFLHFEGVPYRMRYDNLKQAVTRVLKGTAREENRHFVRFREQFGYDAEFCDPAKGNQKGDVEGCVGYIRRNFFSPVIKIKTVAELEKLNDRLAKWCKEEAETTSVPDTNYTVAELFKQEQSKLQLIPSHIDIVGKYITAKANHYSMIPVDLNFYSVPVKYAHRQTDVLVGARTIVVYYKAKEIARHNRSFEKKRQYYDATHYIELFKKKPYTVVNGKPIAQLHPSFGVFFARAYHQECVKNCIDVLKLLKIYTEDQVATAIELAMAYSTYSTGGVTNILNQLQTDEPQIQKLKTFKRPDLIEAKVTPVNLKKYNSLIKGKVLS